MIERETIVTEVWKRITEISGINKSARNPDTPPEAQDCPYAALFELPDIVVKVQKRPGAKVYQRRMSLAVEGFIAGTSEEAASRELTNWIQQIKKALNSEVPWPGGTSDLIETDMTRVVTLDAENHMKGMGIGYEIIYLEDTGKY